MNTGSGASVLPTVRSAPGHAPPPSSQKEGERNSDQQLSTPTSIPTLSTTRSVHGPLTFVPYLPKKLASGWSGLNEPRTGAVPPLIGVAASSSNVVRRVSGTQLMPKLSPAPPLLAESTFVTPSGEMSEIVRSESKVWLMNIETVTLPMADAMLETTMMEFVPAGSASRMTAGKLLSKRTGPPAFVPEGRVSVVVEVIWSDLTVTLRTMGVPQMKSGAVLMVSGPELVACAPVGMSASP